MLPGFHGLAVQRRTGGVRRVDDLAHARKLPHNGLAVEDAVKQRVTRIRRPQVIEGRGGRLGPRDGNALASIRQMAPALTLSQSASSDRAGYGSCRPSLDSQTVYRTVYRTAEFVYN